MAMLLPKKKLGLTDYQLLIDAIKVSEAPISIDSNNGWTIYRAEWANQLLSDPAQVSGFEYWIDHEEDQQAHPVNCASDIASIIGDTIECPFQWSIKTTDGTYWMETDTSDFIRAAKEATLKFKNMTVISLSLNR